MTEGIVLLYPEVGMWEEAQFGGEDGEFIWRMPVPGGACGTFKWKCLEGS